MPLFQAILALTAIKVKGGMVKIPFPLINITLDI